MKSPLVLIPGLGADKRLFRHQKRAFKQALTPSWLLPQKYESLSHYAQRWSGHLKLKPGGYLIGVSFGGMLALEMAKWVKPKAVLLISSCRNPSAIPWYLRMSGHIPSWPLISKTLAKIFPKRSGRFLGSKTKRQQDLLIQMLLETPDSFLRWTLHAILGWEGFKSDRLRVHHIHGECDHLIPVRNVEPDQCIRGGGHLINLTHSKEVNEFPQFNSEVQHLAPAESGGYPKFYETILQAPVVGRT